MDLDKIGAETRQILQDVLDKASLDEGDVFVLGLSSSEVMGGHIGRNSSLEVGQVIVKTILDILLRDGLVTLRLGPEFRVEPGQGIVGFDTGKQRFQLRDRKSVV